MNCTDVKYYLDDYSKGILLDEIRAEIHEHLRYCKKCAKNYDDLITSNAKSAKKKKNIRSEKATRDEIQNARKTYRGKKITANNFPTISTLSDDTEYFKNTLLVKANEINNSKLFVISGIISAIALGIVLAFFVFDHSPSVFWSVEKISGFPIIESQVLTDPGIIKVGERLVTDSESRARIRVGGIGEINVEPLSEIQIIETESSEYELLLTKGKISVITLLAPKLFSIETPSAIIKDFGSMYYVTVNDNSSTSVSVKSGWVKMENNDRRALLSSGTTCFSAPSIGPGIPVAEGATDLFKESLYKLDFENGGDAELSTLLSESRQKDLISLFHLLKQLFPESRGKIYDRISFLFKMPQRITREGIVNGDKDMLARLWTELGAGSISMYQNL